MYTAKINRKEDRGGILEIFVDFTDGVKTYTDSCKPQDADGFKYWVKSRLAAYNSSVQLDTDLVVDAAVDVSDPVVTPPTLTQDEIDRNTWLDKYYKWVRIKQTVVDTGIVPLSNAKVAAMLQNLKDTLKAEYIDLI